MRRHKDSTLMSLTKAQLIDYVRMAEHNQDVTEETLRQQAENVKDWEPVVRCNDCVYWWKENKLCIHPKCCEGVVAVVEAPAKHYCGYGERGNDVSI